MSAGNPPPVFETLPAQKNSDQLSIVYLNMMCAPDAATAFKANENDASARDCRRVGSSEFFSALAGLLVSRAAKEAGGGVLSIKSLTFEDDTAIATQEALMAEVSELLNVDRATVLETAGQSSCHIVLGENPVQDSIGGEATVIYGTEGLVVATMSDEGDIIFMGAVEDLARGRNRRETDYRNAVLFQMSKNGIKLFVPLNNLLDADALVDSPNMQPDDRLTLELDLKWGVYHSEEGEDEKWGALPMTLAIKRYPAPGEVSIATKGKRFEALLRGVSPHHLGIGTDAVPVRGTTRKFDDYATAEEDGSFNHEFDVFHLLGLDPDTYRQTPMAIRALQLAQSAAHTARRLLKTTGEPFHNIPQIPRYMVANNQSCALSEIDAVFPDFFASLQDAFTVDHEGDGFQLSADVAKGILSLVRAITPELRMQKKSVTEPVKK